MAPRCGFEPQFPKSKSGVLPVGRARNRAGREGGIQRAALLPRKLGYEPGLRPASLSLLLLLVRPEGIEPSSTG